MLVKSKVKYIQTLGQKKFRQEEGVFIAEGPKLVLELVSTVAGNIVEIFALKEWIDANKIQLKAVNCVEVSATELEKISQLSTPNQALAVVKNLDSPVPVAKKGEIILALDGIRDPGNMGTIIRIADWFGINQVVCTADSAEVYNPKVVQATMGSIARVRITYLNLHQWLMEQNGISIYATVLEGRDISTVKKVKEGILLIGNESAGISHGILSLADERITIPRRGGAESLNAAVATGIVLSHLI
ncbi:MAG: RNA methyltransferase [Chitinophagaceae bacterium]|nr:RNA methyltransferase [Chitinophagaceae bacterium]